ncbi:hypothetical protein B0H13DRAFT_1850752 [Mycena leptocephala]|nr:hypothetical protein B0H13DRAFT_1850752 [Mycena leptocephala]
MSLDAVDNPQLQGGARFEWITFFMGLSTALAAFGIVSQAYLGSSIKLLILGSIIETGRRLFQWMIVRFRFQYSMTAQLDEGDPSVRVGHTISVLAYISLGHKKACGAAPNMPQSTGYLNSSVGEGTGSRSDVPKIDYRAFGRGSTRKRRIIREPSATVCQVTNVQVSSLALRRIFGHGEIGQY